MDQQQKVTKLKYIKDKGIAVMKDKEEEDIINAANNSGLFDMTLGLSDNDQCKRVAKCGYKKSAISFGDAKVGLMEAYNISSGASITTVHAEKERKCTLVKSAKRITKSVLSIATHITSGLEEEGDNDEQVDEASAIEIDSMDMIDPSRNMLQDKDDEEGAIDRMDNNLEDEFDQNLGRAKEQAQILNNNMNHATANLQLNSSDGEDASSSREEGYGDDIEDQDTQAMWQSTILHQLRMLIKLMSRTMMMHRRFHWGNLMQSMPTSTRS